MISRKLQLPTDVAPHRRSTLPNFNYILVSHAQVLCLPEGMHFSIAAVSAPLASADRAFRDLVKPLSFWALAASRVTNTVKSCDEVVTVPPRRSTVLVMDLRSFSSTHWEMRTTGGLQPSFAECVNIQSD
jgi:hypothetical protein